AVAAEPAPATDSARSAAATAAIAARVALRVRPCTESTPPWSCVRDPSSFATNLEVTKGASCAGGAVMKMSRCVGGDAKRTRARVPAEQRAIATSPHLPSPLSLGEQYRDPYCAPVFREVGRWLRSSWNSRL